ncbi:hypothetical protein [Poseidonocella sp. HB161398]|uniref:hypothetical protein n=1 Tax=Poseidonocella sp. HB161398 TaxID=2320855 RepID=UPI001107B8C5|nr:hypothetical protein [Poseidonocella sp. HB161398]
MARDPQRDGGALADLFAGSGIGLLLGTVMGLSVTPVVATVVGVLATLLAAILGLDAKEGGTRLPAVNALRIGAFGFAAVAGLALGLYARINNPLAAPPRADMARWSEAFPENPTLARQMMVFERTQLQPAEVAFREDRAAPVAAGPSAAARQSVLFSGFGSYDACQQLDPGRFASDADTLAAYGRGDPPVLVRRTAARIAALPEAQRGTALALAHGLLCDVQAGDDP